MPINHNQNQLADLLHLSYLPQIGSKRIQLLLEKFGDAPSALKYGASEWHKLNIPSVSILAIGNAQILHKVEQTLRWSECKHHHILQFTDVAYPINLKRISDPPYLLFVVGNIDFLSNKLQFAIVGARRATVTGLDNAYNFSKQLAKLGVVVTSGLALGIDGAAHRGALAGNGKTIAVLGTGLPNIYPRAHQKLAAQIVEQEGSLISEFPFNAPPNQENFPKRNRIISGLSLGTLVVEAGKRSGSLITARLAAEQGREVWAIPGNLQNLMAQGCHQLIRSGATLVESVEQILETLSNEFKVLQQEVNQSLNQGVSLATGENSPTSPIVKLLRSNNFSAEQLSQFLNKPMSIILSELTDLEIDGTVQNSGGFYTLRS